MLRQDALGLGAQLGGNKAETFGLSLFSGVLGRLNGKSEDEIGRQQQALNNANLRTYQARKYGTMNFVSGGLLVGDQVIPKKEAPCLRNEQSSTEGALEGGRSRKRKRKVGDMEETTQPSEARSGKKRGEEGVPVSRTGASAEGPAAPKRKSRKSESRKSERRKHTSALKCTNELGGAEGPAGDVLHPDTTDAQACATTNTPSLDDRSLSKLEKRARKEERKQRKHERRLLKAKTEEQVQQASKNTLAPSAFGSSRHRYIQQKRLAGLDPQAMREIFMIKTAM